MNTRNTRLSIISILIPAVIVGVGLPLDPRTVMAGPPEPAVGEPRTAPADLPSCEMLGPTYTGCGGEIAPIVNADYEQEVIELVNAYRADEGLPPLKRVVELDRSARYHATDMGQDDYFDHDTYDRVDGALVLVCDTWARIRTYYPSPRAENIAAGYSTPASVMSGWMNSSGHRANILSTTSWEIGIGYYAGSGSWGHYWVQNFGRRSDIYPLIIDREAATTDSREVSLYIYGTWDEARLRTDGDAWSDWQPFQNSLTWTLTGGRGEHTVWAEMRSGGQTTTSSDTIYLDLAAIPPASVTVSGPTTGHIGSDYTFTATVDPDDATQPIAYVWQTPGQPEVEHVGGLSDTVSLSWDTHGSQSITVTATNAGGAAIGAHTIVIQPNPLAEVNISGPTTGFHNTPYAFSATVIPVTATRPVTYVWQASGHAPVMRMNDLSDTITFGWGMTGTKTISVTATNAAGTLVTSTHTITIAQVATAIISPTMGGTLVYTDAQGQTTTVSAPAGAVTNTVILRYIPLTTTHAPPPGQAFANHAFILEAQILEGGTLLLSLTKPVTVTINYSGRDVATMDESSVMLYYRHPSNWVLAATTCSPSLILGPELEENRLRSTVCQLGEFAMFGEQWRLYLPLVLRSS